MRKEVPLESLGGAGGVPVVLRHCDSLLPLSRFSQELRLSHHLHGTHHVLESSPAEKGKRGRRANVAGR